MGRRLRSAGGAAAWLGAVSAWAATVGGSLGHVWWPLELLSPWRMHLAVAALVGGALVAVARRLGAATLAVAAALINLAALAPQRPLRPAPAEAQGPVVRALSVNVLMRNEAHEQVLGVIEATRPDLVALIEVDRRWLAALEPALAEAYPHRALGPHPSNFGVALFSRWPLEAARVIHPGGGAAQALVARVVLDDGRRARVVIAHPFPPTSAARLAWRGRYLEALAEALAREPATPTLLVGDLNMTGAAPGFARLLSRAGLRDSRDGFGLLPTWPAAWGWAGIPIDHALISEHWIVRGRGVGPPVGSDHLPIWVTLELR